MTILSDSVLVESKSARNGQLANISNERAQEILDKAKALIFALWQGIGVATTQQMADYYETPLDAVEAALRRDRVELESDGVHLLKGRQLKGFKQLSASKTESSNAASMVVWTPRAALRLGMLLRDSSVAKAVRTSLLDIVEKLVPAQSERIRELELELQVARSQERTIEIKKVLVQLHGVPTALAIIGNGGVVEVDRPIVDIIDQRSNSRYKGQSLPQICQHLSKMTGIKYKSGAEVGRILESKGAGHLIASCPRTHLDSYVPEEHLHDVYSLLQTGNRQMLLGE